MSARPGKVTRNHEHHVSFYAQIYQQIMQNRYPKKWCGNNDQKGVPHEKPTSIKPLSKRHAETEAENWGGKIPEYYLEVIAKYTKYRKYPRYRKYTKCTKYKMYTKYIIYTKYSMYIYNI